jgi:glycosyltransferase involved in cell wall biosynthesis
MSGGTPNPLVSVMIGVYNGERYLAEAIDSVLAQTYRNFELIVVDDGSDDATPTVARRYGDSIVYVRQQRGGMAAARNTAVSHARGDYFTFLDADDRIPPDKLERQLSTFAADSELDVVFGRVSEFLSPDVDDKVRALLRAPVQDMPWPTPNLMLVKRDSFFRVGSFSTKLKVGIGIDWYARAAELGLAMAIPSFVVLERRLHAENNGIRERHARPQYLHVLKAALDRRRDEPELDASTRNPRPRAGT